MRTSVVLGHHAFASRSVKRYIVGRARQACIDHQADGRNDHHEPSVEDDRGSCVCAPREWDGGNTVDVRDCDDQERHVLDAVPDHVLVFLEEFVHEYLGDEEDGQNHDDPEALQGIDRVHDVDAGYEGQRQDNSRHPIYSFAGKRHCDLPVVDGLSS